jgi:hypothetical protein
MYLLRNSDFYQDTKPELSSLHINHVVSSDYHPLSNGMFIWRRLYIYCAVELKKIKG